MKYIYIRDGGLIYREFDQEIKLVRISETDFLPEKDQSFKISFYKNQMHILFINGREKILVSLEKSKEQTSSYATIANSLGGQFAPPEKEYKDDTLEQDDKKPVEKEQDRQDNLTTEHKDVQLRLK